MFRKVMEVYLENNTEHTKSVSPWEKCRLLKQAFFKGLMGELGGCPLIA